MTPTTLRTTDPDAIRRWCDARGARPASAVDPGAAPALRLRFGEDGERAEAPDDALARCEPLTWDEFFAEFERAELAFLYRERSADGDTSRYCKLVPRSPGSIA